MFMVIHSLCEALRYLKGGRRAVKEEKGAEEGVCPICEHCTPADQVTPLPGDELQRRSSAHTVVGGRGLKIHRTRHKSDMADMVDTQGQGSKDFPGLRLDRNSSAPRIQAVACSDDMLGAGGREGGGHLPRTLSTSVLRIKQRRSFWEKFVNAPSEDSELDGGGGEKSGGFVLGVGQNPPSPYRQPKYYRTSSIENYRKFHPGYRDML